MQERISRQRIQGLFDKPLMELIFEAQGVHRQHHPSGEVQLSTLCSIKTGACVEDCAYCAQSSRYDTAVEASPLMSPQAVLHDAQAALAQGATRFCMGAAWRRVADKDLPALKEMVAGVKRLGLETCMTLGSLTPQQAGELRQAGLDYYNHNLDTSRDYYKDVITTRDFEERLETLAAVRQAGIHVCSGGILGMGEGREDRIGLLYELANLPSPPESVPINRLVPIAGTPLATEPKALIDDFEFVRCIAVARVLLPRSTVRLSAGREGMDEPLQALCFLAGANSIFYGEKLLTAGNPQAEADRALLKKLGLKAQEPLNL